MQADLSHLRRRIIETCAKAGEGHIPSALSILDIVWALYDGVLRGTPDEDDRDRFFLSKGHGCLALYVVLNERGLIPDEWLDRFCQPGAELLGHPERDVAHGIEATTGSLGHGLPMAVGVAAALKMRGSSARVYCLVGDSECEEGSVWEAAHMAARLELSNLTLIIDNNKTSPNRIDGEKFRTDLASKFGAFGWFISHINGHDQDQIRQSSVVSGGRQPFCIVADTVKGYGVEVMEKQPNAWHHRSPTAVELPILLGSVR